eukprot:CAMPEP_0175128396 /NCGR_PEP_ID=MMETSP0087-20121206/4905_1 /TAXON_ID=136419 /ORGANISM="Unknown Unknown, Strain D1" /LENGTH=753 /DNA_ID=CAMNT_0016410453 /DNA_START=24 /DNA_END=2285 /DNA_ORIENTATION=-
MPEPQSKKLKSAPCIIYTYTDEAPFLATYSFLPIIKAFSGPCGINVETRDISLAGRVLANFPENLTAEQKVGDHLAELGQKCLTPEANIIKLPNISASVPQLKECVKELQAQGYKIPDFPEDPKTDEEKKIAAQFKKVMGSAVNPVLREGNSDRRAPPAVKEYARQHPHSMGKWGADSKSHVSTMGANDFRHNEQSRTIGEGTTATIQHVASDGTVTILKKGLALQAGEIIDSTFMSRKALLQFLDEQMEDAKKNSVLFSLHMKATMMKVSDPIIFGHCVKVFFKNVFEKHGTALNKIGVNVNNGFGDLLSKIGSLPADEKAAIEAEIKAAFDSRPSLAMVDSDNGITNLHVPSDVIIDASMPAMIRTSGNMWNAEGKEAPAKAVIPDSSYAGVYSAVIDFCKANGPFDPKTMGSCPNVGLMAQKAEEYGSHDKTFQMKSDGVVQITTDSGVLMEHKVEEGDIWRACQVKDAPIRDWVKLAITRARATGATAIFWLDETRAHDAELLKKVNVYLKDHDTSGLDIQIMAPAAACSYTCNLLKQSKDCISVTGNVLRDYNTDLFPILEVGTSAKMLSIVPLMAGGGLFETGAGGSAPKHVQQFNQEGHLRWDSLGEFLALACSFAHVSDLYDCPRAKVLGSTLDEATTQYLLNNKAPSRRVNQIDNRGTHYWVALYWAQALAAQKEDAQLAEHFAGLAKSLEEKQATIEAELLAAQGKPCDIGGYYHSNVQLTTAAMRPSPTLNAIIDAGITSSL